MSKGPVCWPLTATNSWICGGSGGGEAPPMPGWACAVKHAAHGAGHLSAHAEAHADADAGGSQAAGIIGGIVDRTGGLVLGIGLHVADGPHGAGLVDGPLHLLRQPDVLDLHLRQFQPERLDRRGRS